MKLQLLKIVYLLLEIYFLSNKFAQDNLILYARIQTCITYGTKFPFTNKRKPLFWGDIQFYLGKGPIYVHKVSSKKAMIV